MAKKVTKKNGKKTAPARRVTPATFRRAMAATVQQAGGAGMGASQGRVFRQALLDNVVLAWGGAAVAWPLSW